MRLRAVITLVRAAMHNADTIGAQVPLAVALEHESIGSIGPRHPTEKLPCVQRRRVVQHECQQPLAVAAFTQSREDLDRGTFGAWVQEVDGSVFAIAPDGVDVREIEAQ